jgi:hypothetical protein
VSSGEAVVAPASAESLALKPSILVPLAAQALLSEKRNIAKSAGNKKRDILSPVLLSSGTFLLVAFCLF